MKIIFTIFLMSLFAALASAQGVVPIIEVQSGGLLGGTENGRFLDAKTTFDKLDGKGRYSLFGLTGKTGELTATVERPDADRCTDYYYAKRDSDATRGTGIGAGRNWNPVPRVPKAISLKDKTYLKIVSDILRSKGVPKAKAIIEQAVRVDLDGDGREEVLLTASSYGGTIRPGAKADDYSFVVLRKIVAGKVKNIIIAEEYIEKTVDFGATSRFEVSSVVDLNGDGKMEIVLYGEYYEGSGASVYRIKGAKAVEITELQTGCGA
jgi:hypothetical protein